MADCTIAERALAANNQGITDIYIHNRALMSMLAISCPFEE